MLSGIPSQPRLLLTSSTKDNQLLLPPFQPTPLYQQRTTIRAGVQVQVDFSPTTGAPLQASLRRKQPKVLGLLQMSLPESKSAASPLEAVGDRDPAGGGGQAPISGRKDMRHVWTGSRPRASPGRPPQPKRTATLHDNVDAVKAVESREAALMPLLRSRSPSVAPSGRPLAGVPTRGSSSFPQQVVRPLPTKERSSNCLTKSKDDSTGTDREGGMSSSISESDERQPEPDLSSGEPLQEPAATELIFRLERRGDGWGEEIFPHLVMEQRPIDAPRKRQRKRDNMPEPWEVRTYPRAWPEPSALILPAQSEPRSTYISALCPEQDTS